MSWKWVLALGVAGLLAIGVFAACGDDDDDNDSGSTGDDDAAGCTQDSLCEMAVECGIGYDTVEECLEAAEAGVADCADAAGLLSCNCDCGDAYDTCEDWSNCGTDCWETYC